MLNVVCVKVGTKYGPEYVNILHDMVRRNLPEGEAGRFICITDDARGLNSLISSYLPPKGLTGWWAKLSLFAPNLFPRGDRILYFDLDVAIVGGLDDLAAYDGDFAILREFGSSPGWQSSIMAWRAGYATEVWTEWERQGRPEVCGGDQEWIEEVLGKADILQDLYPHAFRSYKIDCRIGEYPRGAKVVVFHGEPKPDNCAEEWVQMVWKIGGGTAAELDLVCNTHDDELKQNIRSACKRDVPWLTRIPPHGEHAVIVGGAPSVKNHLGEIAWRQSLGQKIFALNNTFDYLSNNFAVVPDAQIIVDAREENAKFVNPFSLSRLYIASQCSPAVWDKAKNLKTVLWHSYSEILDDALKGIDQKPTCLIGGGTTVGLSAMALVYALGYRQIHIYGMDSSYTDGEHHAYQQQLNDNERVLDVICNGRKFKAAAWMVAQANQFQQLAIKLAEDGCVITVHGDGLIPWIARNLQMESLPDQAIVQDENGVFWPSRDKICRDYTPASLRSIPKISFRCAGHRVAVQAGGNVGLWPQELSHYFDNVLTFEPDKLNFECLQMNCEAPNVTAHRQALGATPGRASLERDPSNCGAHRIIDGDEIEVVTIDSLLLGACDLIQLDVEGYELFALMGAERTIDKFHPVIVVELKSLGESYAVSDAVVVSWLEDRGYREKQKMGRDVLFVPIQQEETWHSTTAQSQDTTPA